MTGQIVIAPSTEVVSEFHVLKRGTAWLSPLRYPGSKRRLAAYLRAVLAAQEDPPGLFIEPFAGGASVAIQLLGEGSVKRIGLADRDPLVAAFWKTVFFDSEWLINQVEEIEVSLEGWKEMKARQHERGLSCREQALLCLFLNRTSFSGILSDTAGPIGGMSQSSEYTIDCRFPRETLTRRISQLADLSERVAFVWNRTWQQTFAHVRGMQRRGTLPKDVFYYLDPPFFQKADRLYAYFFENGDHGELRDHLLVASEPWLLSYDACPDVLGHYGEEESLSLGIVQLLYNTPKSGNNGTASEVIVSNLPSLPEGVELWRRGERRGVVTRCL